LPYADPVTGKAPLGELGGGVGTRAVSSGRAVC
jgi:hypothetical protein